MMSVKSSGIQIRRMRHEDLSYVCDIEVANQDHPWPFSIFNDCFQANYDCYVVIKQLNIIAFGIMSIVLDEGHILNIGVMPSEQRHGYGTHLLKAMLNDAKKLTRMVWLEVRVSNKAAINLYEKFGFKQISIRKDYYQMQNTREDAAVYCLDMINYDPPL